MTFDIESDAAAVVECAARGGLALFPVDVGYAIVGHQEAAVERLFAIKQRSFSKQCGVFGSYEILKDIAFLDPSDLNVVKAIIEEYRYPISLVVPIDTTHPFLGRLTPRTRELSSRENTVDILLNAGILHDAIAHQSWRQGIPVVGSSANRSLTGSKYNLLDVEPEIRGGADLVVDYGSTRYSHPEGMGSTIIELPSYRILRKGILLRPICDAVKTLAGKSPW